VRWEGALAGGIEFDFENGNFGASDGSYDSQSTPIALSAEGS
jgi:hypothetical protein